MKRISALRQAVFDWVREVAHITWWLVLLDYPYILLFISDAAAHEGIRGAHRLQRSGDDDMAVHSIHYTTKT